MTETVGASALLVPPDASTMTPDQAKTEIGKLQSDANFRKGLLAGEAEQKQRWGDLLKAAHGTPAPAAAVEPTAASSDVAIVTQAGLDLSGDVGKDVLAILSGKPVSAAIKNAAAAKWELLRRDKAFAQRFADGDAEARRTVTTLNVLRSAKVEAA